MTIVALDQRAQLDDRIRAAEGACYAHYGASPLEDRVSVLTPAGRTGIRLTRFSPTAPSDLPPVVLLHGIGSVSVLAAPLLPHLADREVIAVDTPGHGLSDRCILPRGTDLRHFATSVVDGVREHLGVDAIDVVGHSLGGQFGLYAALDLPKHVRRLALLGAPGASLAGARPAAGMKLMAVPGLGKMVLGIRMDDQRFVEINERYAVGRGAFDATPAAMVTAARLIASRPGNATSIASFFRTLLRRGSIRPEVVVATAELGRIDQPVLFAWGDDDLFLTPALAAASIVAIRDVHLVRAKGVGHAPWLQQPGLFGAAVATHLA